MSERILSLDHTHMQSAQARDLPDDLEDDIINKAGYVTWVHNGKVVAIQGVKRRNNQKKVTGISMMVTSAQPMPELAESELFDTSSDESEVEYIEEAEGLLMTLVKQALPHGAITDRIAWPSPFFAWMYYAYPNDRILAAGQLMKTVQMAEAHELAALYEREASRHYHSDSSFPTIRESELAIKQLTSFCMGAMPWESVAQVFPPPPLGKPTRPWVELQLDIARDTIKMYKQTADEYLLWRQSYATILARCAMFLQEHADWFGLAYSDQHQCLYIPHVAPTVKCWDPQAGIKKPGVPAGDTPVLNPSRAVFRPPVRSKPVKREHSPEV